MAVETSIVIRTLNESTHLEELLKGIHAQNYKNWEIVLVDSGSTDGTPDIARRYDARIFHIPSHEFTFGRSLNIGCREARGDYLVFASGHVWPVSNNWLRNMITPFEDPSVAMVYGRQQGTGSSSLAEHRDLNAQYGRTSHILVDEPKGNNGNAAIRRELWLDQPFDESLPGLEDVDWARRAEKRGYRVYYAADAPVVHAHEETLRQVYRRHQREAVATKWMFPNYTLAWSGLLRALPYFIVRDVLYAFRHKKQRRKIFQTSGNRIAQFLGIYFGVRYQKQLMRDLVNRQDVPEVHEKLVFDGPGSCRLKEADTPSLQPGEVLVHVGYVGVSGGDVELARHGWGQYQANAPRRPVRPGHEFAGVVVKTTANAGTLRRGKKVAGKFSMGCGKCPSCLSGSNGHELCSAHNSALPESGAYASYMAVASNDLHELPDDMSLKQGAMVEQVAVCVEALAILGAASGKQACVLGCNSIGNICSQILQARGVRVTAVDRDPKRVALLYKYDIDTLAEPGDLGKYDYLIAADVRSDELPGPLAGLKPSAKAMVLGLSGCNAGISAPDMDSGNGRVFNHYAASESSSWQEAVRLIASGTINLDDHIATVEPLGAYGRIWEGVESGESFKVLINVAKKLKAL
jgi:threonine dehydrogenase-like Zn-dependent dehydrogenase/glycosyltransferase involved in cell wall biosynthesis